MYGGKAIAAGDVVYLFASENEGGQGLLARGRVVSAEAVPRRAGVDRQTPRVTVQLRREATAVRPLGRKELKAFPAVLTGGPESELNFKFYRQATNKIAGVSAETAAFLETFFAKGV